MHLIASLQAGHRFVWTTFWSFGVLSTGSERLAREHRMCKVNIVASGKIIMPHRDRSLVTTFRQLSGLYLLCLLFTEEMRGNNIAGSCLTRSAERRYLYYITNIEESDEKAAKARSENARVETGRHPQPSPRLCFRHSLQRESILRPQRSPSGSLRDRSEEHT